MDVSFLVAMLARSLACSKGHTVTYSLDTLASHGRRCLYGTGIVVVVVATTTGRRRRRRLLLQCLLVEATLVHDGTGIATKSVAQGLEARAHNAVFDATMLGHLVAQHRQGATAKPQGIGQEAIQDAVGTASGGGDIVGGLLECKARTQGGKQAKTGTGLATLARLHIKLFRHGFCFLGF